ncbi:MAG: heavy metal sensor histidine kinase [Bacteroidota bacterium]
MTVLGHQSVTWRLTLLFAAVSTAVLLVLGLLVGSLVERHFEDLDLELLDGKLELVQHALAAVGSPGELGTLPARLDESLIGHHGLAVAIWKADGQALYTTPDADFPPTLRAAPMAEGHRPVTWRGNAGQLLRGVVGPANFSFPGHRDVVVTISTDLGHHQHFMHSFQAALWTVVGLAAVVSGLLGWLAARRGLAPLRDICRDAAGITATRLSHRLSADAIPAELAEVARTLNEMLARLEESFQRLSAFSSDLAHELRTPVSNLLTQTQVMLAKPRTVAEYQDVLASNAEEFERLSKTIADMLFLAKAENDLVVPHLERVDLRGEVDGLIEFYEALAEESGVTLSVDGQAVVSGDRLMLRRAIGNLLSNAFHHTPRDGRIDIRLSRGADGVTSLAVENTGESIAPEHLPRLFDRFYRADPSRQRLADGAGLGLAITRSILRAHGGDTFVRSNDGITTFGLTLPA